MVVFDLKNANELENEIESVHVCMFSFCEWADSLSSTERLYVPDVSAFMTNSRATLKQRNFEQDSQCSICLPKNRINSLVILHLLCVLMK